MREGVGLGGGAIDAGLAGGAMGAALSGADVLCAEFRAGNEGGGRSSSSSSELSWVASVKVGMVATFESLGVAFGVVCGEGVGCNDSSVALSSWAGGASDGSVAALRGSALPSCDCAGFPSIDALSV